MKFSAFAAAAALALAGVSVPALAQAEGLSVGATVYGPDGAAVGTIEQVDGDAVVVSTGSMTAALPSNVFATGDNGPTIAVNKADLEAAIAAASSQAKAEVEANLAVGAEVYSVDGVLLGTVERLGEDGLVVVELDSGPVALGKDQMAVQDGKLTFLATAADVEAAAAAAQGG